MKNMERITTKRWIRSPRGKIFGVVTGLAEWRDLNPEMTRMVVFLIILFTGVFPGLAIYFFLALILPMQCDDDIIRKYGDGQPIDVSFEEVKEERTKSSYDKERDWDERFSRGEK